MRGVSALLFGLVLLLVAGCVDRDPTPPPPAVVPPPPPSPPVTAETAMRPVPANEVPGFLDVGEREELVTALERNRRWLAGRPADRVFVFGPRETTAAAMLAACERLLGVLAAEPSPEELAAEVRATFDVLEAVGGEDGRVLFTGYYEPLVAGSLRPGPGYRIPVYGPPPGTIQADLGDFAPDLAGRRLVGRLRDGRLVPLPTRREIRESGVYRGREIAWAADPVDLFFVEIQGSGALRLADGRELRIGYAGSNGRPYRSIGRLLADEGHMAIEDVTMPAIRAWLAAHPDEVRRVLDHNESTVFFRRLEGPPVGNLGVPVTPRRSLAVDQSLFPPGALAWATFPLPAAAGERARRPDGRVARFVLAQDTGGAIRGPGRADFFWGRGPAAERWAGLMKQSGRLYFFVPREPP